MTPREQRTALAVLLAVIVVLAADLFAWLRLGRLARDLVTLREAAAARRGNADGPTGDSEADLAALRAQLSEED